MLFRERLLKTHLYLLAFVLTNFIVFLSLGITIHQNIIFITKMIIYLTGLILFFMTIRPFRKRAFYFSFYLLSPIIIVLSWLADGIFGAILASFFLFMFYPPQPKFKDKNYVFYERFSGFMGACCSYDIFQDKLFIFQKNVGEVRLYGETFKNSTYIVKGDTGYLKVTTKKYDTSYTNSYYIDTTLVISMK